MTWICGLSKTVGQSHIASGLPCQDAVEARIISPSRFVVALSDGAGSAVKSQIGSQSLVESACALVGNFLETVSKLEPELLDRIVREAILSARQKLKALGLPDDFHATAIIVIGIDKEVRIYHIGDGAVMVGQGINSTKLLIHRSNPENGEFSNETFFYTQEHWEQHLRLQVVKHPQFLVLVSDGVDPFLWDNKGTRVGFLKPLLTKLQNLDEKQISHELDQIINDPRTNDVTNDDKSIIVIFNDEFARTNLANKDFIDASPPVFKDPENVDQELKAAFQKKIQEQSQQINGPQNVHQTKAPKKKSLRLVFLSLFIVLLFLAGVTFLFIGNNFASIKSMVLRDLSRLSNLEVNISVDLNTKSNEPVVKSDQADKSDSQAAVNREPNQITPTKSIESSAADEIIKATPIENKSSNKVDSKTKDIKIKKSQKPNQSTKPVEMSPGIGE